MTHTIVENGKTFEVIYNLEHSRHSRRRASQRGITDHIISLALDFAVPIMKQGLIFYLVKSRLIPDSLDPHIRSRLENLVIVVSGDDNQIITCYKSPMAFRSIRRKEKVRLDSERNKIVQDYGFIL